MEQYSLHNYAHFVFTLYTAIPVPVATTCPICPDTPPITIPTEQPTIPTCPPCEQPPPPATCPAVTCPNTTKATTSTNQPTPQECPPCQLPPAPACPYTITLYRYLLETYTEVRTVTAPQTCSRSATPIAQGAITDTNQITLGVGTAMLAAGVVIVTGSIIVALFGIIVWSRRKR